MDGGESKTFQDGLPEFIGQLILLQFHIFLGVPGQKCVLLSTVGFLKTCQGQLNIKDGVKAYLFVKVLLWKA